MPLTCNPPTAMSKHAIWATLACVLLVTANGQNDSLPRDLYSWRDWVWHDQEFRKCPIYYGIIRFWA